MEGYEAILRFTDMMSGDWGWVPVAAGTLILALIVNFFRKISGDH